MHRVFKQMSTNALNKTNTAGLEQNLDKTKKDKRHCGLSRSMFRNCGKALVSGSQHMEASHLLR